MNARALSIAAALTFACGALPPPEPAPMGPPLAASRSCPLDRKVGEFRVERTDSFTAVSGSVAEAVVPVDVRELVVESGGCRLLRKRQLICTPTCGAGMTCGEGGRCIRYPDNLDAGTVRIAGLALPVKMQPDPAGRRYFTTGLPHPGFAEGADIQLHASGADVPAFSLAGQGVRALAVIDRPLTMEPDRPFPIDWQPGSASPVRVELTLNIDQHGLTPATLICRSDDSGRLEVPADLVGRLLAAGTSGYPQAVLSRQTVDATDLPPGCVELIVASAVQKSVTVAGHNPCRTDGDCPAGRRCDTALQSCR
jgi:hypothetical protein